MRLHALSSLENDTRHWREKAGVMRPCMFQVFCDSKTPIYADKPEGPFKRGWSEPRKGMFLQWGLDSDDGASYSVALVEDEEGRVHEVIASKIMFTDKEFQNFFRSLK
jgi:hypothetical protein